MAHGRAGGTAPGSSPPGPPRRTSSACPNKLKAHIRAELSREVNAFHAVSNRRRAEHVGQAGNVLNPEANRQIAQEAGQVRWVFVAEPLAVCAVR